MNLAYRCPSLCPAALRHLRTDRAHLVRPDRPLSAVHADSESAPIRLRKVAPDAHRVGSRAANAGGTRHVTADAVAPCPAIVHHDARCRSERRLCRRYLDFNRAGAGPSPSAASAGNTGIGSSQAGCDQLGSHRRLELAKHPIASLADPLALAHWRKRRYPESASRPNPKPANVDVLGSGVATDEE